MLLVVILRVPSRSLLLHRSRIKANWSSSEASGAEAAQQEEVTCSVCPAPPKEDFSCCCCCCYRWSGLTLLWSNPSNLAATTSSAPPPQVVVLARNIVFVEELERAHSLLAAWMITCEETGSITTYYTWREGEDTFDFEQIQSPFLFSFYSVWTLPLVGLKEKLRRLDSNIYFLYVKSSLVCMLQSIWVRYLNEWVWLGWKAQLIQIRYKNTAV